MKIAKIYLLSLFLATGFLLQAQNVKTKEITRTELKNKIAGYWIGQLTGNYFGYPFNALYNESPVSFDVSKMFNYFNKGNTTIHEANYKGNIGVVCGYLGGSLSDVDHDMEYLILHALEEYGFDITYEELAPMLSKNVKRMAGRSLMKAIESYDNGMSLPNTGKNQNNPYSHDLMASISTEIWGAIYPGMIQKAADGAEWFGGISNDDYAVYLAKFYAAMYSAAYFESDINTLLQIGLQQIPEDNILFQAILNVQKWSTENSDWRDTRKLIYDNYFKSELADSLRLTDALPNGLMGIMAMLYSDADYKYNLSIATSAGLNCDNQTATTGGLIGLMYGKNNLPEDYTGNPGTYINATRDSLPYKTSIDNIIERMCDLAETAIIENGGQKTSKSGETVYTIKTDSLPTYLSPSAQYRIRPLNSTLFLDNSKSVLSLNAKDTITVNQYWRIEQTGKSEFKIISIADTTNLEVNLGSTTDGALVILEDNAAKPEQKWIIEDMGGYYQVTASHSSMVLGIGSQQEIIQQTDNDLDSQSWIFEKVTPKPSTSALYEPFDYDLDSELNGLGKSGDGWGGSWNVYEGSSSSLTMQAPMDYAGLQTEGNSLIGYLPSWGHRAYRSLNPKWEDSGSDIWISFLLQIDNPSQESGSWQGLSLFNGDNERVLIGKDWGKSNLGLIGNDAGGSVETLTSAFSGDLNWIVVKIETNGNPANENAYMWINPDPTTEPEIANASLNNTVNINNGFDRIVCHMGAPGNVSCSFDEIRMAHTYTDVVTSPVITQINSNIDADTDLKVIPTISENSFYVTIEAAEATIEVYDVLGKKISSQKASKGIEEISIKNTGWYVIRTIADGHTHITKVYKK